MVGGPGAVCSSRRGRHGGRTDRRGTLGRHGTEVLSKFTARLSVDGERGDHIAII